MSDSMVRSGVAGLPVPTFEHRAFTAPPSLVDATVAIVTTAGLVPPGEPSWKPNDESYRVLKRGDRNFELKHLSPNFDRVGFVADINVVYPIDRLEEMAAAGEMGAVSETHLSFMGAQNETMASIRNDTGPAAAKLLKESGVDVVLLTPV